MRPCQDLFKEIDDGEKYNNQQNESGDASSPKPFKTNLHLQRQPQPQPQPDGGGGSSSIASGLLHPSNFLPATAMWAVALATGGSGSTIWMLPVTAGAATATSESQAMWPFAAAAPPPQGGGGKRHSNSDSDPAAFYAEVQPSRWS
ncbi:putative transcription factor [Sesbania bispinosa]|nr:putative transcription factor [Sesbania bispinosa]